MRMGFELLKLIRRYCQPIVGNTDVFKVVYLNRATRFFNFPIMHGWLGVNLNIGSIGEITTTDLIKQGEQN